MVGMQAGLLSKLGACFSGYAWACGRRHMYMHRTGLIAVEALCLVAQLWQA